MANKPIRPHLANREACCCGFRTGRSRAMRARIAMAFFLCLLHGVCLARDLHPFSARVSVSISANEKIKGLIKTYISSELRSLGGIVLTDVKPRWVLNIVALEPETKGGLKMGVILSTVVLEPFDNRYVVSQVSPKSKEVVSSFTSGLYRYSDHWIHTGASRDLKNLCEKIVANFDSNYIKPVKDSRQRYMDTVQPKMNQAITP
jgi:hypothetical protein